MNKSTCIIDLFKLFCPSKVGQTEMNKTDKRIDSSLPPKEFLYQAGKCGMIDHFGEVCEYLLSGECCNFKHTFGVVT